MVRSAADEFQSYISRQRREQGHSHAKMSDRADGHESRGNILDIFRRRSRNDGDVSVPPPDAGQTPDMLISEAALAEVVASTEALIDEHDFAATHTLVTDPAAEPSQTYHPDGPSQEKKNMNANIEDQVAQHFQESLVAMVNDSVVMIEKMISESKSTIVDLKEHRALVIGQSDAHLATIDENRALMNRQIANEITNAEAQIEALRQAIATLQEDMKEQNAAFDTLKNKAQTKRHDDLELVDRMITAEEAKLDTLVTPKSGSTEIEHQKQPKPAKGKPALVKTEQVELTTTQQQHEPAAVAG